jgi:hypothetical protein
MAKGEAAGGHGGGSGGFAREKVANIKGLHNAWWNRDDGMNKEALAKYRAKYKGKSQEEKNDIAEHEKPVLVQIAWAKGRYHVEVLNGKHRVTAAFDAGAKRINAEVEIHYRNGRSTEWTGPIKL